MDLYVDTYIRVCVHTHIHIYAHTHTRIHTHTYTHMYTHTYTYTYTYTYTHTRLNSKALHEEEVRVIRTYTIMHTCEHIQDPAPKITHALQLSQRFPQPIVVHTYMSSL